MNSNTWIPNQNLSRFELEDFDNVAGNSVTLCIEEGVDIQLLKQQASKFEVQQILVYASNFGSSSIEEVFPGIKIFLHRLREKAQRESNGNLYATNLDCDYDPQTGAWKEDQ